SQRQKIRHKRSLTAVGDARIVLRSMAGRFWVAI
ncbi:MAG: hypothetical protein ACI8Z9_002381, partial [Paraglaciecola sp.]